jgi:Tol biopolymer transport system component
VNLPSQYRCTQLRLSPDEQWVALEVLDLQASSYDIWLLELATARVTKFTTDAANERDPVFSKDGRRIAFTSDRNGTRDIYEKEVGGREDSPLMRSANDKYLEDWPASDLLVFRISEGFGGLFRLGAAEPERLLPASDYRRDEFNVSPNGEWIAFNTEESGNYEVKVASFPAFRNQTAVSAGGGSVARWRKNGEEIFYLTMSGELMATRIKHDSNDGALQVAAPEVLTQTRINVSGGRDQYAASGDGQRFLLLETVESQPVPPITVITNWHSLLKPD